jgi:SAM-dependent methyltransferase
VVARGNPWTVPVTPKVIAAARAGTWTIVVTPTVPVPRAWFGDLGGKRVLGLAAGGGQQGPILAAAGTRVTVLDNAPGQLARDREVAAREGLTIETVEGDMRALPFEDEAFDLILNPCSNCFVDDVRAVWREARRVLRPGGEIIAGFGHPLLFVFDRAAEDRGELVFAHAAPYSDLTSPPPDERERILASGEPLTFGHTLEDQIGGQIDAGLAIVGFFDDPAPTWPISKYTAVFSATRSRPI